MSLSQEIIDGLNNMNVYAQRAKLGDLIVAATSGGTGKGDASLIEANSYLNFPNLGDENNLYIDTSKNSVYRWDPTNLKYFMIGSSLENVYENIEIIIGGNANG